MFFVRGEMVKWGKYSLQKQKESFWQKTFFGALRKGVLTLELAFILPFFLLGTLTLIGFMDVMKIQTEIISQLCEEAMEEGMYAHLSGEGPIVEKSQTYAYRLPVSLVPLPAMIITNQGRVHSWTGMDEDAETDTVEAMVYITESGSVYHTSCHCSYLDLSISQAAGDQVENLRNQQGGKYKPCESCSKGEPPAEIVYITGQGDRYHNQVSCSRLKRTVRLVPISEVEGRRQCSRCKEGKEVN